MMNQELTKSKAPLIKGEALSALLERSTEQGGFVPAWIWKFVGDLAVEVYEKGKSERLPSDKLWSYQDLAERWGVSQRQARRIADDLRLAKVPTGANSVRFRPQAVADAEARASGELRRRSSAVWGGREG